MTILGRGDLSPQHRQSQSTRWLITALVLVLLGGGAYAAVAGLSGGSSKPKLSTLPVCAAPLGPTATPLPASERPGSVHLTVDNATLRSGLAAGVAAQLKRRGFDVTSVGNTPTTMKSGVATVRYGKSHHLVALELAAQIPGATLVATPEGAVELDLGPSYQRLATRQAAHTAYEQSLPAPTPTPVVTPTVSPSASPTCRPRPGQVSSSG